MVLSSANCLQASLYECYTVYTRDRAPGQNSGCDQRMLSCVSCQNLRHIRDTVPSEHPSGSETSFRLYDTLTRGRPYSPGAFEQHLNLDGSEYHNVAQGLGQWLWLWLNPSLYHICDVYYNLPCPVLILQSFLKGIGQVDRFPLLDTGQSGGNRLEFVCHLIIQRVEGHRQV